MNLLLYFMVSAGFIICAIGFWMVKDDINELREKIKSLTEAMDRIKEPNNE